MMSILERPPVSAVYDRRFGPTRRPFGMNLDQRFIYLRGTYARVVEDVRQGLDRREGLVVVTGEPGTGKTLLCRTLLTRLDKAALPSVVLDPNITFDELLAHVLTDFGVMDASQRQQLMPGTSVRYQLIGALQQFLRSLIPLGSYALIIIDEAHYLDAAFLEQLRLLMNFETDETKLLQVVLVGQPDLDRRLRRPDMRQLDQRVARRCQLEVMSPDDVEGYIEQRLSIAQRLALSEEKATRKPRRLDGDVASHVRFTPSAIRLVAARSGGVPRLVNVLCERSLEIGRERQSLTIDTRTVRQAARNLAMRSATRPRIPGRRGAAYAVAALLFLTTGSALWTWLHPGASPSTSSPANVLAAASPAAVQRVSGPVAVRPLPIVDTFGVTAASFAADQQAAAAAAQLESSGLPAFAWHPQGSRWHQVIVGPYVTEAEAEEARRRLVAYGYPDAQVFLESAGAASAAQSQVDSVRVVNR